MNDTDMPAGPDGLVRGYPVETPVGTMYLRHVGWGVLVDNSSNTIPSHESRPYLHIRGKLFTATVGVYPDGNIERAYVNKVVTGPRMSASDSAAPTDRQTIIDAARAAALAWIEEHPEHVAAGEQYRARMDYASALALFHRLEPEYKEAKRALAKAETALSNADKKLAALQA